MRRFLILLPALSWTAACSLDWGSLEPEGGLPPDATGDVAKIPDAHADVQKESSTMDAPSDVVVDSGDASTADADDGAVDSPVDVYDAGTPETGPDASEAGLDASDAGCTYTFTGTLATYDLSGLSGIATSGPATATASGITAADITRASALTPQSATGGINSSNWSTGALDSTRYYTFKITPPSGCALAITSVYLDTLSSAKGPSSGAVATSADSYSATSSFSPGTASSVSLSVSGATAVIEVRVYGYNALTSGGTMRIQNKMTVSGSLK